MIQGSEIIIILLVALVVLGPRRLPEMARKMGRWASELRQAAKEIRRGLEAEVAELKEPVDEMTRDFKEVGKDLREPMKEISEEARDVDPRRYEWTGPKPVSGPTPEDAMADLEKMEEEAEQVEDEGDTEVAQ